MKRVPLLRHTPLVRHRALRAKPRPDTDKVTTETRAFVLHRDVLLMGGCVAAKYDPEHECRDQWGYPHRPDDLAKLTLDHVNEGYGRMGQRAPSDPSHLISSCFSAHLGGWTTRKDHRALIRWLLGGQAA